MDDRAQAEGEKRVREVLIEPLMRRGLAKPASLTKAAWEDSLREVERKLAYMTEMNLAALEEIAAANPAGKDRDRMPIANAILDWAGQVQAPPADASPLMRAVFAHAMGREAVQQGWAPELLEEVRRARRWPGEFALRQAKERAAQSRRAVQDLERREQRGEVLTQPQAAWLRSRRAAEEKCREMAGLL